MLFFSLRTASESNLLSFAFITSWSKFEENYWPTNIVCNNINVNGHKNIATSSWLMHHVVIINTISSPKPLEQNMPLLIFVGRTGIRIFVCILDLVIKQLTQKLYNTVMKKQKFTFHKFEMKNKKHLAHSFQFGFRPKTIICWRK